MDILFTIALLLFTTQFFYQAPVSRKIYLDSLWKQTTENKHKYDRIVIDYYAIRDKYPFNDYYKTRALQMTGTTTRRDNMQIKGH
jgi:hypothetical protein